MNTPPLSEAAEKSSVVALREGRLLVVGDGQRTRVALAETLRDSGFAVETAIDGPEALAHVRDTEFDAVLVDLRTRERDGLGTLALIREIRSGDELPVLVATRESDADVLNHALSVGANDCIADPFGGPAAVARIRGQIARKVATDARRLSEKRLAIAIAGSNDGIWDWDLRTDRIYLSARWQTIVGLAPREADVPPDSWLDRIHSDDRQGMLKDLRSSLGGLTDQFVSEHRIRHENGTYRWVLVRGAVDRSAEGEAERIGGSMTDITDRKSIDRLTGLPNRAPLSERIDRTLARLRQHPGQSAALFVINVDDVATINEGYGEHFGDMVLRTVADRLTNTLRPTDVVASLGGDEFSVFLDRIEDPAHSLRIAKRIQDVVAETIEGEEHSINLTAGIGVAISAERHLRGSDMISEAFSALNRAKKTGKGGIALFDENMQATAARRLDTERALRLAIDSGEMQLAYQPIVDMKSGTLVGFEGLARWNHPEKGMISPAEFIPVAEESGLIVPMTDWLLDVAAQTAHDWATTYASGRDFFISVNLSARNFETASLVRDTEAVLRRHDIDASYLKVEVTETQMMHDIDAARRTLEEFREAGIRIALDDFGTGHSSLSYLTNLPLDALKIDRSFVARADREPAKRKILQAIVALGKSLDLSIIGEGIETFGEHIIARNLGCDAGQGYLYARPTAAADLANVLESWGVDLDELIG